MIRTAAAYAVTFVLLVGGNIAFGMLMGTMNAQLVVVHAMGVISAFITLPIVKSLFPSPERITQA